MIGSPVYARHNRRARFLIVLILLCGIILPAGVAQAGTYSAKVLALRPASLVGYWSLGETSGTTATDSSGNGNNGSYVGAVLNGIIGPDGLPAPTFDGMNDYIIVPHSTALNPSSITLAAWVNATEWTFWRGIISKTDGATWTTGYGLFSPSSDGEIEGYYGGYQNGVIASFSITGQWIHFAFTYDATTNVATLYQNGTVISVDTVTPAAIGTEDLLIGAQAGGQYFYGAIARVGVWNVALSQAEITELATPTGTPDATPTPQPPPFAVVIDTPGGRQGGIIFSITAGEIVIAVFIFVGCVIILRRAVDRGN